MSIQSAYIIVLKALDLGLPVKLPDFPYPLHLGEGNALCYQMERAEHNGDGETVLKETVFMGWDPPISWFLNQCEKMDTDDVFALSANCALNKIKNSKEVF